MSFLQNCHKNLLGKTRSTAQFGLKMSLLKERFNSYISYSALNVKKTVRSAILFFDNKKSRLKSTTSLSIELVPSVIRKPSVLWRWLFTSYRFYFSVIILVILMNTVVASAIDKTLSEIYPPIRTEKLFGLMVQEQNDPRIEWQRKLITGVSWTAIFGFNAYVLLLCLPKIVRKATCKAKEKEDKADRLITDKPSESILLYNKALKLAVDQSHESILKSKIDTLDNGFKSGKIGGSSSILPSTTSENNGTGTLVLSKSQLCNNPEQTKVVGPDGRYRIERKLGQGAMGTVFLGKDQLLFRDVALKKLSADGNSDQNLVTRFQQEARALARLSHPNIVQIYDFVREEDRYWIAMEYVEGKDLDTLISQNGKYEEAEAIGLCINIAEAMDYAHNRGVVHRDFKPSNVIVNLSGEPKVMDFGLAKLTQSNTATMEGSLIGSPAFMSPEQAMGKPADERSDIYALGVTLYQLLTGKLPFEGDLKSILTQKIAGHKPQLKLLEGQVQTGLAITLNNMLDVDPDKRPATMNDVNKAIKKIHTVYS